MNRILLLAAASLFCVSASSAYASDPSFGDPTQTKSPRLQERLPRPIVDPNAAGTVPTLVTVGEDFFGPSPTVFGNQAHSDSRVIRSFSALTDYDTRLLGRALIPPDTMGAVGKTQFVQLINGAFGVFDKANGKLLGATSDNGFWSQLGMTGTGGDPRILYSKAHDRWLAIGFGADAKDINIAVSETHDALGNWQATKFEGLARLPGVNTGGSVLQTIADYPTLAMDTNAIYIGTNNFRQEVPNGPTGYRGTTLNVIPIADIFAAAGPSAANKVSFVTSFVGGDPGNDTTRGFAIQGVNSSEASTTGNVVAASAFVFGALTYDILNAGTAGASQGVSTLIGAAYDGNDAARQPGRPGNPVLRNIDALDDRISGNAWEMNGRIYFAQTITEPGTDFTRVRVMVLDSLTKAVLEEEIIGTGAFDYYQPSLAVNAAGVVVVNYNRSGYSDADTDGDGLEDGRITILAQIFATQGDGTLLAQGTPITVKVSDTPGYLNGAPEATGIPAGRQRWGDYSAVTLDPTDDSVFWLIGQFADDPYEVTRPGYPPASGFSRWGQWIAAIETGATGAVVPEPATWATMLLGFGVVGFAARRRRRTIAHAEA